MKRPLLARLGWFSLIYVASVVALGLIALAIRALIG